MSGAYNHVMEVRTKNKIKALWRLCPRRHLGLAFGLFLMCVYHLLRGNRAVMQALCEHLARPWHRGMGRLFSLVPFSVAELVYAALVLFVVIYLTVQIAGLVRGTERGKRLYKTAVTLLCAASLLYGGFCMLWGVYYSASDAQQALGLVAEPVSEEDLYLVGSYFRELANTYAEKTQRDENGCYTADKEALFAASAQLYGSVAAQYPSLDGPALRAKPMLFSKFMSWINFTGFFFPFTGEANLNVDAPQSLLPATIAHELAHQRGVAREDEANFVAVLACMEADNPDYRYSAALVALIHLGNALYEADPARYVQLREGYSEAVLADLRQNSAYWARYETVAAELSGEVYEGFMATYGEDRGLRSYGACVDLLVACYREKALLATAAP